MAFDELVVIDLDRVALLERLCCVIFAERLPCHAFRVTRIDELVYDTTEFLGAHGKLIGRLLVAQVLRDGGQEMSANVVVDAPGIAVRFATS